MDSGAASAFGNWWSGTETSQRRFVWGENTIREERDAAGAVVKRFFEQGVKVESGPAAGVYFYVRDHQGSIRALTDAAGNVRALYSYDPFGRRTRLAGDLEADFGFAGMFWAAEAGLNLTRYRAYDPALGRWLSRDPLANAELDQGANLYAYVHNDPVNRVDPLGLKDNCCGDALGELNFLLKEYQRRCKTNPYTEQTEGVCAAFPKLIGEATIKLYECHQAPCKPKKPKPAPKPPRKPPGCQ